MPREKNLQQRIVNDLQSLGAVVLVLTPGILSTRFTPDVYFSLRGVGSMWLELKRDSTQRMSRGQEIMVGRLNFHDTPAYSINSWDQWIAVKETHKFAHYSRATRKKK